MSFYSNKTQETRLYTLLYSNHTKCICFISPLGGDDSKQAELSVSVSWNSHEISQPPLHHLKTRSGSPFVGSTDIQPGSQSKLGLSDWKRGGAVLKRGVSVFTHNHNPWQLNAINIFNRLEFHTFSCIEINYVHCNHWTITKSFFVILKATMAVWAFFSLTVSTNSKKHSKKVKIG